MYIRRYRHVDLPVIVELFHQTVHAVNARDYSVDQLDAWAPQQADFGAWDVRLSSSFTYVAEHEGTLVGFANLTREGIIDMLYVHKDHQRKRIATALVNTIQEHARALSLEVLYTEASVTAEPFFSSIGFLATTEQQKLHRGFLFANTVMTKNLGRPSSVNGQQDSSREPR
jgi:putative acetyltransferase